MNRESCILCACKHVAQARVLLLECVQGYPQHHWFAMGHLAEASDELAKDHINLCELVRTHRKRLENNPSYPFPFTEVILEIASRGSEEVEKKVNDIEQEFKDKSIDELLKWWKEVRQ